MHTPDSEFQETYEAFASGNIGEVQQKFSSIASADYRTEGHRLELPMGPQNISKETIEFEEVIKNILGHFSGVAPLDPPPKIEIQPPSKKGQKSQLIINLPGKDPINLSELMKEVNWAHIRLDRKDDKYYQQFISPTGVSAIKPKLPGKSEAPTEAYFREKDTYNGLAALSGSELFALNIYSGQDEFGFNDREKKPGKYYAALNACLRGDDPAEIFRNGKAEPLDGDELTNSACEMLIHLAQINSGLNKPVPVVPAVTFRKEWTMPESVIKERIQAVKEGGEIVCNMQMASTSHTRPGFKPTEGLGARGCALAFIDLHGVDITAVSQSGSENEVLIPPSQTQIVGHMVNSKGEHIFICRNVRAPKAFDPRTGEEISYAEAAKLVGNTIAVATELTDGPTFRPLSAEEDRYQFASINQLTDAVHYAIEEHLSKPYIDTDVYKTNLTADIDGTTIHRPNHGPVHTLRKMSYAEPMANIFNQSQMHIIGKEVARLNEALAAESKTYEAILPLDPTTFRIAADLIFRLSDDELAEYCQTEEGEFAGHGLFRNQEELNLYRNLVKGKSKLEPKDVMIITGPDLVKIQCALLFSVTGRDSDCGFKDNPVAYARYKKQSRENFERYFTTDMGEFDGRNIFSSREEMLEFAELVQNMGNPKFEAKNEKLALCYDTMNTCHDMDLWRCYPAGEMPKVINKYKDKHLDTKLHPQMDLLLDYTKECVENTGKGPMMGGYSKDFVELTENPEACLKKIGTFNAFMAARVYNLDKKVMSKEEWEAKAIEAIAALPEKEFNAVIDILAMERGPFGKEAKEALPLPAPHPYGKEGNVFREGKMHKEPVHNPDGCRDFYKKHQTAIQAARKELQQAAKPATKSKGTMLTSTASQAKAKMGQTEPEQASKERSKIKPSKPPTD